MLASLFLIFSLFYVQPSLKCRSIGDDDKRSFDDLRPIVVDVDRDGRADTIIPRVYSVKVGRPARGAKGKAKETHWITFDLKTAKGRTLKSFYRYQYGADITNYWVYALVPCARHGQVQLTFYSGDDTTDETVVLRYAREKFAIHSRKTTKYNI